MITGYEPQDQNQPVTWVRGYPLYAAHFVVLVFVGSMIVTTLLMFSGANRVLDLLPFSSGLVLRGEVWRVFTYGLINPPSLWFVIDMFMIAWFGREVEKFFGRGRFLMLYGWLYFLPPILFTLIGFVRPATLAGQTGGFGLFIAFATLYPNVPMILNVLAKWVAVVLVGIYTLMALSSQNWVSLLSLWTTVGFAYGFVCYQQGRFHLPTLRLPKAKPNLRVLPDPAPKKISNVKVVKEDSMAEIDALLDKIARSGIDSLTPKERAKLDTARERFRKRTSGE